MKLRLTDYTSKVLRRFQILNAELHDLKLNHKYVVFESDDWGSLRMPSVSVLENLTKQGLNFFTDIGYDKYDTIEADDDIELTLDLLDRYKDFDGNSPVITLNSVVANPDFEKIRREDFQQYFYETVDITYRCNTKSNNVLKIFKEGINRNLIQIQYHGREHLNVPVWLRLLRESNNVVLNAFNSRVWSMKIDKSRYHINHLLAAYDFINQDDISEGCNSLLDGIRVFEKIYGYKPLSMIAPNYTWNREVEKAAFIGGIRFFQGGRVQKLPFYDMDRKKICPVHYIGQVNALGQMYTVRNCVWEPSQSLVFNSDYCLAQISKAFSKGRPAIISAHRLNFIGGLDKSVRDRNLRDLDKLLNELIRNFPDVRFVSSDVLGLIVMKKINKSYVIEESII